ncbi:MAG: lamin tail domain-containing protein [Myxococcales bacterium]|nr:lamin tail domain-containing protein [Myxococcales bacterium]
MNARPTFLHAAGALALVLACAPPPPDRACKGLVAGDLVISEFMNDPEGVDTGHEYLELFNATGQAIGLNGLTLYAGRVDGSSSKTHVLRSGTVASKGYFVLGDAREQPYPAFLSYSYGDAMSLGNSEGSIGLRCGSSVIDEVKYYSAGKAGRARTLDGKYVPDSAVNDIEGNWCDAPAEFATNSYGSPGAANAPCAGLPGSCVDSLTNASRPVVSPAAGELVITELMPDPKAVTDTNGEWFEVLVRADVDLNGLELSNGSSKSVVSAEKCLRVPTGTYAVFARQGDGGVNGGLAEVAGTFTFGLVNSGGQIAVRVGDAGVDQISYGAAQSGVASQLDPAKLDAAANDDPAAFCPATQTYGAGDKGTPGAPNSACPTPPDPNQCLDPTSGQPRAMVRPAVGDLIITELMPNPAAVLDSDGEWFEVLVKSEVDLNGLELVNEGTGRASLNSQSCLRPGADAYVLFARSGDPAVNGGLPDKVLGTFGFDLGNTGLRALTLRLDGGVLDQIAYATSISGASAQLSADKLDPVLNDDAGSFCVTSAAKTYGGSPDGGADGGPTLGDRGTPGDVNETCP